MGYEVDVAECGDWSGASGFNPTNLPHTDYGCSYQRNLGLMLSDPGDLIESDDFGGMDAQRATIVIQSYRAGELTGAEVSEQEEGSAATLGQE